MGGYRSLVFALAIMAMLGLSSAERLSLIQWGQSPLRSEEGFTNSYLDGYGSMQRPDFIFSGPMGARNISRFVGAAPTLVLVHEDREIWASGLSQSGVVEPSYHLAQLNFSGCPDEGLGDWQSIKDVGILNPTSERLSAIWAAVNRTDGRSAWMSFPHNESCASAGIYEPVNSALPIDKMFCTLKLCASLVAGKMYLWGSESHLDMFGYAAAAVPETPWLVDTSTWTAQLPEAASYHFTDVAIGSGIVAATSDHLGSNNVIVSWGTSLGTQRGCTATVGNPCSFDAGFDIFNIVAGHSHVLVLASNSIVYAYGSNAYGQLAQPVDTVPNSLVPLPCNSLFIQSGLIYSIGAVHHTSFAVAYTGALYVWGSNVNENGVPGMLGLGDFVSAYITHPTLVELPHHPQVAALLVQSTPICPTAGGCTVNVWVYAPDHLASPLTPSPDEEAMSPLPTPDYSLQESVVLTWGARKNSGNRRVSARQDGAQGLLGPTPVDLPRDRSYSSLYASDTSIYVLDDEGEIWGWGSKLVFSNGTSDPVLAEVQTSPISRSSISTPSPTPIVHFALSDRTALWMPEGNSLKGAIAGNPTPFTYNVGFSHAQVRSIESSASHFALLLDNNTIYTVPNSYVGSGVWLGYSQPVAGGNLVELENIELVALGNKFTVIYYRDSLTNPLKLAAFGGVSPEILGNTLVSHIAAPTDVNMTNVEGVFVHPIQHISCSASYTLVVDASGSVFGFGDEHSGYMPYGLGRNRSQAKGQVALVYSSEEFGGSPVTEVTALEIDIAFALTSSGHVYGWGFSNGFFRAPFGYTESEVLTPVFIDVNEVDGVRYNIRKLLRSTASTADGDLPISVLATPVEPSNPPANREWYTWGHNGFDASWLNWWGQIDKMPLYSFPKPVYRTYYSDRVFPFRANVATVAVGHKHVHFLANDRVYDFSAMPMFGLLEIPLLRNVTKIASAGDSLWFLKDGQVGCHTWESPGPMNLCQTPGIGSGPLVDIGALVGGGSATDLQCSATACMIRVDHTTGGETTFFHYGRYINPTTKIALYGAQGTPDSLTSNGYEDFRLTSLSTQTDNTGYVFHMKRIVGADARFLSFRRSLDGTLVGSTTVLVVASTAPRVWSCGSQHCLLLLSNGVLHGWGSNRDGQIGTASSVLDFAEIISIAPPNLKDVAGVNRATLALTESGALYSWGVDAGISDTYLVDIPTRGTFQHVPYPVTTTPRLLGTNVNFTLVTVNAMDITGTNYDFIGFISIDAPRSPEPSAGPPTPSTPSGNPVPNSPTPNCNGIAPSSAAVCELRDGNWVWVISGSLIISPDSSVTISNDVIVEGDLVVNGDGLSIATDAGGKLPFLNITGSTTFLSPMTILLSKADQKRMDKEDDESPKKILESGSTLPDDLSKVLTVKAEKNCRKVKADASKEELGQRHSLNVAFKISSAGCNVWWIVLASVLGAVVLLVLIFLIIYATVPSFRLMVRPYKGSN
jgi:alpha-tubulin suppressor-like RCC1 family protein